MRKKVILFVICTLFLTSIAYAESAEEWVAKAKGYSLAEHGVEMVKACTKAIELDPNCIEAYKLRVTFYNAKEPLLAINDYTKLIELEPTKDTNYICRAKMYQSINRIDLAINDYSKLIELYPNIFSYYYERGRLYKISGKYEAAINDYNKIIENTNESYAYLERAELFKMMGEFDLANADMIKGGKLHKYDWLDKGGGDIVLIFIFPIIVIVAIVVVCVLLFYVIKKSIKKNKE